MVGLEDRLNHTHSWSLPARGAEAAHITVESAVLTDGSAG
jgi:hypothetical protein